MKKILAIHYSQTGQLTDIVDHFLNPFLTQPDIEVENLRVYPEVSYPFPWPSDSFFNTMPESVLGITIPLQPFTLRHNDYDLIVFAYQPWFLSPSIPAYSALLHPAIQNVLYGAKVITLIGSRNMWLNAQQKVKEVLKESGAMLIANIALADRNPNLISAITIMHWMFTGKKDRWLGIFPVPGIAESDILQTSNYGRIVLNAVLAGDIHDLQSKLVSAGAAEVVPNYIFIETRAKHLFFIWAKLINGSSKRRLLLKVFKYYLIVALFVIAPIVLMINMFIFRPFLTRKINAQVRYFQDVKL